MKWLVERTRQEMLTSVCGVSTSLVLLVEMPVMKVWGGGINCHHTFGGFEQPDL